ncbi:MAG: hypothetical protein H6658_20405 [Ardenticatenaceae bacterium]|nr:hypothetical protein [Ardenticatenaceae bacterium]
MSVVRGGNSWIGVGEGNGRFFQGSIDEVKIYIRGLSDAEVMSLYQK